MKLLAIDYGQSRTGIAVSDAGGRMAFPRCTLHKKTRAAFLEQLCALIAEEDPGAIVIGLPLLADGSESLGTRQIRNFARSLQRRLALPIYLMEEFLSTHEAAAQMREVGHRPKNGELDQQAAVRILESFLHQKEAHRNQI